MRPPSDAAASLAEPPAAAGSFPVAGPGAVRHAELRAAVDLVGGGSELVSRYHTSPLKIAKTFKLGRQLAVVQMDGSPGMLAGDRYTFDWRLAENARLYATNQAYTRVHPSGDGEQRLVQRFELARDAVLEWMPEPIMLFRGARLLAETEIALAPGAMCMVSEVVSPGRLSRGESFEYALYDNRLSVRLDGELIHYQRQRWEPGLLPIESAACFGDATHVGAFYVFSDRVNAGVAARLRERMSDVGALEALGVVWGVAHTARHGLVVQAAGSAAWRLERLLRAAWDEARGLLLGEPPLRLFRTQ